MLTLYDYLPSQNAYKVRLLLSHLGRDYRSELIAIFDGEGQRPDYLELNPTGAVPVLRFAHGGVLAESNAILFHLARKTRYLPEDAFLQAKVLQWLFFEADYVQSTIATLRHWIMTGKATRRRAELVESKRMGSLKVLAILDREFARRQFLVDDAYSIADMSVFAYVHRAEEAKLPLADYPQLCAWIGRVRQQEGFLDKTYAYDIDPHSGRELP
ncbi:glutathione S-transferase family protein [Dongia soli]|uniref:Glutathione S-transferase family protein n=1 Tax=Dongia soli TaxID=600628 RepID=A0ABU5EG69_9PROT|nr:glutathione S-transferase family protein [Dongia soli]MDY0884601.1 glutathione S-transferase family protein [Dongia soli]